MNYVYHIYRGYLRGGKLFPLNILKSKFPSVYKKHAEKYDDRSELMKQKVPILDCLWNDVIHLCPIHPQKIVAALRVFNYNWHCKKFWRIRTTYFTEVNTVIYLYRNDDYAKRDFVPYNEDLVGKLDSLPRETIKYYEKSLKIGKKPLFFHRVPHVLYKGAISKQELEEITL